MKWCIMVVVKLVCPDYHNSKNPALSSGRSRPSPALSPADLLSGGQVFFLFLFCCYILFEILIWGFFVLAATFCFRSVNYGFAV
jgi:hypothetical protein